VTRFGGDPLSKGIPTESVIQATIQGISLAQRKFQRMYDDEYWLDTAPEYFLTVITAETLLKLKGAKWVTLEHNVSSAMQDAGVVTKGRKALRVLRGRCDILLWWGSNQPRAMIELKRCVVSSNAVRKDIERIQNVLLKKTKVHTIKFGLIGFFSAVDRLKKRSGKTPKERQAKRLKTILDGARRVAKQGIDIQLRQSNIHEEDGLAWVAGCLLIKPARQV
jgi:hypothetical protein